MMNGTTTSTRSDMHSTAGGGAEAAAETADLHGSADGLVSDNSLFDLMVHEIIGHQIEQTVVAYETTAAPMVS